MFYHGQHLGVEAWQPLPGHLASTRCFGFREHARSPGIFDAAGGRSCRVACSRRSSRNLGCGQGRNWLMVGQPLHEGTITGTRSVGHSPMPMIPHQLVCGFCRGKSHPQKFLPPVIWYKQIQAIFTLTRSQERRSRSIQITC